MTTVAVAKKLGGRAVLGRRLRSDADLIDAVRHGLPAEALDLIFADLAIENISQASVYKLIGWRDSRAFLSVRKRPSATDPADESGWRSPIAPSVGNAPLICLRVIPGP